MSSFPSDGIDLSNTMGALLIGVLFATALWGVSCVQVWYYFDSYSHDHPIHRCLVGLAFLTDSLHQLFIVHLVFNYLVLHFGNTGRLEHVLWSFYAEVLMNGCTGLLVQAFYAHRVWTLKKNLPLVAGISALIVAEFTVTMAYGIKGLGDNLDTFIKLEKLKPISLSVNALGAASDIAISISICNLLNASKTGFSWSDHTINRLIIYTVNTGMITCVSAVMSLILILALPNSFAYVAFYFIVGRLYINSLLTTLNARKRLRGTNGGSVETHSLQDHTRAKREPITQIQVQIETIRDLDMDMDMKDESDADIHSRSTSIVEAGKMHLV